VPIVQSAERILFSVDDVAGTVTAHVEVGYEGDPTGFAWVVPVPDLPTIGLSSDLLFDALEGYADPKYVLHERTDGSCATSSDSADTGDWAADTFDADTDWDTWDTANPPVTVVAESTVGPFDTAVLQASNSSALLTWLGANGYVTPPGLGSALVPYLQAGNYVVAFRLTSPNAEGDLVPVALTYASDTPEIPIQLTAIAAAPDMALDVWILGPERAVPDNYLHMVVNEAAIDWSSGGDNYRELVSAAADEAGGQAFATVQSADPGFLSGAVLPGGDFDVTTLYAYTDPVDFMSAWSQAGLPITEQVRAVWSTHFPMP
jgi:hypothetical protein